MTTSPLLAVNNLVKIYDSFKVVDGVSFTVPEGTCLGLLGPNGAGKTTTIEIIEGVSKPTSGDIFYRRKPRGSEFNEKIGIQFQDTALLSYLSVRETLETFRALYRQPLPMDELIALCHLESFLPQINDKISGGQKQRLLLALAFINQPDLIFLDEPSTGLDPHARRDLWQIVESIKDRGKTLVLTAHYMEEAQTLCDDIVIMDHGRVIAHGPSEQLIARHCQGQRILVPKTRLTRPLKNFPFPFTERGAQIEIHPQDLLSGIEFLVAQGLDLRDISVHAPNLEDVFIHLTGRKLRNGNAL